MNHTVTFDQTILLLGGLSALAIAGWIVIRERWAMPSLAFAAGMLLLAGELGGGLLERRDFNPRTQMVYHQLKLTILAFAPGLWLAFAVTYSRGNPRVYLRSWLPGIFGLGTIPLLLVFLFPRDLVWDTGQGLQLGFAGRLSHVILVLTSTAVLMNLERTFRASVGVMRWQLKYMVIGVATLFLTRVYTSTQALIFSTMNGELDVFNAVALMVCALFAFVSVTRTKGFALDLYPSTTLVYRSLTVIVVGVYLLTVGFLARAAKLLGSSTTTIPIQTLVLLIALVGLGIVLLSDRARLQAKRFVSRHLRRPTYDVQKIWRQFSDCTAGQTCEADLCRAATKWLSETFELLSVTIWLFPPRGEGVRFGGSTSLTEDAAASLLAELGNTSDLSLQLPALKEPINIDSASDATVEHLRRLHPVKFAHGGQRTCVPILAHNELVAILMVGDRVSGVPLSVEEIDVLKSVSGQIAGDLVRLHLSGKLLESKQIEAFQTMATFFVHDLKNTGWTLSLLVQNLRTHFDDPAFREEAVNALSKSVTRINDLVTRIGSLREEFKINKAPQDLNTLLAAVLKEFAGMTDVMLVSNFGRVEELHLDGEQMQKVFRNLVLNAKEASRANGEIHVQTGQQNGYAVVTVRDNGGGMSPEFMRNQLFRPFQTTKKKGIGIGMYQSKMIVEAHNGRITAESRSGEGTTFRVLLPVGKE